MRRSSIIALALVMVACSEDQSASQASYVDDALPESIDIFEGQLIALNGQPVTSVLKVRFYSTDGDEVADRYFLDSDCFDAGYFDERHGVFLSGHSPIGTGTEKSPAHLVKQSADNHRTKRCPVDDPANFSRVMDLMYEGATLTVAGERARLVSKTGLSAELAQVVPPILLD